MPRRRLKPKRICTLPECCGEMSTEDTHTPSLRSAPENASSCMNIMLEFIARTEARAEEERQRADERAEEERQRAEERFRLLLETFSGKTAHEKSDDKSEDGGREPDGYCTSYNPPGNDSRSYAQMTSNLAPGPRPQILRIPGNVKLLSEIPSMSEFVTWRKSWEDYALINRVDLHDRQTQLAALRTHMSAEFLTVYDESIMVDGRIENQHTVEEVLRVIEEFVRARKNIVVDRHEFYKRRQQPGESFEHFFVSLRQLGRQAAICDHCGDTQLVTLITVGVLDPELQKKLLEIRPAPDLNQVLTICRAFESASIDQNATKYTVRYAEKAEERQKAPRPCNKQKLENKHEKCRRCGGQRHPQGKECYAKRLTCRFCNVQGHIEKACFKKRASYENKPAKRAETIRMQHASAKKWNRSVIVEVETSKGRKRILASPDTGAEISVLPAKVLPNLGLTTGELRSADVIVTSYNGQRDSPMGYFHGTVRLDDRETQDKIYVQKGTDQFLLSGEVSERLGIVTFPKHVAKADAVMAEERSRIAEMTKSLPLNPSPRQIEEIEEMILKEFEDVFNSDGQLKPMKGRPMRIHVKPDAVPHAVTAARQVAFGLRDKVSDELQSMERKGIIERVGDEVADWCQPMVVVKKPDGGVRICVDYTKLNGNVLRPVHPMRIPKDAVESVNPGDRFFTTLDATQGYWQMELDPESQHLTTFITQEGRFRFKRCPMGLCSAGDEYNRRGDIALAGLRDVEKVVDDILVHSKDFGRHVNTVLLVLQRCRENGITLSKKKFNFCKQSVKYAGFRITSDGIMADNEKIQAIAEFPSPTNITELRSFMGLANQLGCFISELAAVTSPLRGLLQRKNVFLWTRDHEAAFQKAKAILTEPPVLQPFDPNLPTVLQTDASRTKGIGFALLQKKENKLVLVQCGSRFLSDAERRYATVELELLAVVWGIQKCHLYLLGLSHFDVVVDHRPLIQILNQKGLDEIDNPRIFRLKEKLMPFTFNAEWRKGKEHLIPDSLSRAPVTQPDCVDEAFERDLAYGMQTKVNSLAIQLRDDDCMDNTRDRLLEELEVAAENDTTYQELIKVIGGGFPTRSVQLPRELQPYFKLRNDLTVHGPLVMFHSRIVIPKPMRKEVLRRLHLSHQGIEKTKLRARQTVFWPGITTDIINTIEACGSCQEGRPSLPAERFETDPTPTRPFQETAADLFQYAGHYYIAYVDRYSGWTEVNKFTKCPTSNSVLSQLRKYFVQFGVPLKFRSDGGSQFSSEETRVFMQKWGVNHVFSAPHFPSSNGLAESAVKAMKSLIAATTRNGDITGEVFLQGLLEWRNTPRGVQPSPAEMVFGAPLRSLVPMHRTMFAERWRKEGMRMDKRRLTSEDTSLCVHKSNHPTLMPGQKCWVQDPHTKRWDSCGEIIQAKWRNYTVKMPSGRVIWRNRRHVRPCASSS